MAPDRIHRALSADGTEIAGRALGQGPPLVLIHAGLGDGDLDFGALLPLLEDRFTCYLPSTRSRGLSGHSEDLGPERHVEDIVAFVDSIGEPVGLVATSGGAISALGAAARTAAVAAVAVYEPVAFEVLGEEEGPAFEAALARTGELAQQGRLADAARTLMAALADDDELAALAASSYFEAAGRYVPVLLGQIQQLAQAHTPSPTDPSELARITAPVLILQGSQTPLRWFADSVRHVADHVAEAEVRKIPRTRHHALWVDPEPAARELARFFTTRHAALTPFAAG